MLFVDNEDYRNEEYDKRPVGVPSINEKIRKSYRTLVKNLGREFPSSVYENRISFGGDTLACHLSIGLRKILQHLRGVRGEKPYVSSAVCTVF